MGHRLLSVDVMLEPSFPGLLTTILQVDVVLWELNVLTSLPVVYGL